MSYRIDVQDAVVGFDQINEILQIAVSTTLHNRGISSAALTLLLTDDDHMRQLNQDFRGHNQSTDVLSFPAGDAQLETPEELLYFGDIAISVPIAMKQAQKSGHSLAAELQLLAIHGVLHLLGFDHLDSEDKAHMWSVQEEILDSLGLHNIAPTET